MKRKVKRVALYEMPIAEIYCESCEREFRVIPEFDEKLTCPYCGSSEVVDADDVEFEWVDVDDVKVVLLKEVKGW